MTQSFNVIVDASGHPEYVTFQRWSDANDARTFQWQPFGGYLSDFELFDGFWLPTNVVAGNRLGTDAYFPFFKATIVRIEFIKRADQARTCRSPW